MIRFEDIDWAICAGIHADQLVLSVRTSVPRAQAGEILHLYYVRRIGSHYVVERRLSLSRAVYFNRRSYGVRRLVDRLRELEESSSPA